MTGPVSTDRLAGITRYPSETYRDLDLNRLAVFAIGWLRDSRIPLSFENLVVALYRMFPDRFSLHGYDYPDANRVNRTLLQLGPKYRNWARGSTRTGYALTPFGETTLNETRERLRSPDVVQGKGRRSERPYTWNARADIEELKSTPAFRRFVEAGPQILVNDDVWNALNAFSYTPEEAVRSRLITLAEYASQAEDDEAARFVAALRDRFEAMTIAKRGGGRRA